MDVAVSALRAELRSWIERARDGEDVVITERGVPVARLTGIEAAPLIERLEREGLLDAPDEPERVPAASLERPTPAKPEGLAGLVRRMRR